LPHSTQKPMKLIERLIQIGTNEGDLILDNCSGSGTLGVECIKNDRDFIMIEQNEDYYNMSLKRIDDLLYIYR
jgi:site-specific DNA-methyltransferase (adenine-specific)